jgi:hypothetical protein
VLTTTTFFVGLDQVELPTTAAPGERFANHYRLTTDRTQIVKLVKPFATHMGHVETSWLIGGGAKALAYRVSEQEVDPADIGGSLDRLLVSDMEAISLLQLQLWRVKDNAVHFDRCWVAAQMSVGTVVNCNTWASRPSCADGTFQSVRFDHEELRIARMLASSGKINWLSAPAPTLLVHGTLRFDRFNYFLAVARSSTDVAFKIAHYCSALESLVANQQVELSHQVSERVAVALTAPGPDRIKIFKCIKDGYGYRSKTVHGASFKQKDIDRLSECAINLDHVCRQLLYEYYNEDGKLRAALEDSDVAMTEFFIQRTLGGS